MIAGTCVYITVLLLRDVMPKIKRWPEAISGAAQREGLAEIIYRPNTLCLD